MSDAHPPIEHLVEIILDCVHREYPNQIGHSMRSDEDAQPPRQLHPAFFGSYDWHSAVHGHWALVRATRVLPPGELRDRAAAAVRSSLTAEKIAGEISYFTRRPQFECPYGIAWLSLLASELDGAEHSWEAERAALAPLADQIEESFRNYLTRLTHPVRSGQHDQSAFALGLFLDTARLRNDGRTEQAIVECAMRLHESDRDAPRHFEPSNHDFLSPSLASADLLARILPAEAFAEWLSGLLPDLPEDGSANWWSPIDCPDPSDGRISHRIGLNLSRAWMLERIAEHLPSADRRSSALLAASDQHREAGLAGIDPAHYSGAHWLGTFAIYLLCGRSEGPRPRS